MQAVQHDLLDGLVTCGICGVAHPRAERGQEAAVADLSMAPCARLFAHAIQGLLLDELIPAPYSIADELDPFRGFPYPGLRVQRESQARPQKLLDVGQKTPKKSLAFVQNKEIVHISNIELHPANVLDVVVKFVQVDVGEKLAHKVSDWKPRPRRAVQDLVYKPHEAFILDSLREDRPEDGSVHRCEKGLHVRLQIVVIPWFAQEISHAPGRLMRSLAYSAGVGIVDHAPLEYRLYDRVQRVLDDAVAEGKRHDLPFLRLVDHEGAIGADLVRFPYQLVL